MEVLKFSFDEINVMSRLLASRVKNCNFTSVLGIARGGLIPATVISYELDVPLLTCGVSSYNNKEKNELNITQDIKIDSLPKDSNLLIVDDICDTGETIQWLSNRLTLGGVKHTKVCVFTKPKHTKYLDHYASVVPEDKWIVFPWE
tara:strand:- start:416 stop:853 length:438 start_codon:yes stop_codon:yes gene_type:complete